MVVRGIIDVGVCYVVMRYLFPHVLLVPVTVVVSLSSLARCAARFRVVLDSEAGQVAVTYGPWTRRVPLPRVERVEEVLRFGTEIRFRDGVHFSYSPLKRRRRLGRTLRMRTGFEGMDLAITEAAAAARAGLPDPPAGQGLSGTRPVVAASLISGVALLLLTVSALVEAQAGGWVVHAAAVLLRVWFGAWGAVLLLWGSVEFCRTWRRRHTARQPDLS